MGWFLSRRKGSRRISHTRRNLTVELLEQRLPPGGWWEPGTGINITGISAPALGGIMVFGDSTTMDIVGSGEDFDTWHEDDGGPGSD